MSEKIERSDFWKLIGLVIVVAIVAALVSNLVATTLFHGSQPALVGGATAGVIAVTVMRQMKKLRRAPKPPDA